MIVSKETPVVAEFTPILGDVRLPEGEPGPHSPQRHREKIGPHLRLENAFQICTDTVLSADEDPELTPRVVRRAKEGKPLDVIPVGVGKCDGDVVELLMRGGDQIFAWPPDSGPVTDIQLVFPPKSINSRSGTGMDPLVP